MKRYLLLAILIAFVAAVPTIVREGAFIFPNDFTNQLIPFTLETKRMLASGAPWWSWNTYFGDNFYAGFVYYTLTSPFAWLTCLLPYSWITYSFVVFYALKYAAAFLTSRWYFRKMGITATTASIGGLLYAFSSYTIGASCYYIFFEPVIVFPVLLVAIERFLRRESYGATCLSLAVALTVFINFYMAPASLIAAALYTGCRLFEPSVRKAGAKYPRLVLSGIALVLIGVAAAAFIELPVLQHTLGGPRVTHYSGFDRDAWWLALDRLQALFVPAVSEGPQYFSLLSGYNCCALCLPVVGVLLAAGAARRDWLTLLVAGFLLCYLTPLSTPFCLFTSAAYVRWGYALALVLVLMTLRYIDSGAPRLTVSKAVAYGVLCLAVLAVVAAATLAARSMGEKGIDAAMLHDHLPVLWAYLAMIAMGTIALAAYARTKRKSVLTAGIAVCVVAQLVTYYAFDTDICIKPDDKTIPKRFTLHSNLPRNGGDTRFRTAFFSRCAKWSYYNVPMLTGRAGVQTYHSMQNNNVLDFFYMAKPSRTFVDFQYLAPTRNLRTFYALMSCRDVVAYRGDTLFTHHRSELRLIPVAHTTDYDTYINRDYLPMGLVYDYYVPQSYVDSMLHCEPMPDVPLVLLAALVVPDSAVARYAQYLKPLPTAQPLDADSVIAARRDTRASSFRGTTTGFTDTATMSRTNYRLYTVPADRGFTAYVDGQETPIHKVSLGLATVLVPRGQHAIEFRFFPAGLRTGLIISLIALLIIAAIATGEHKRNCKL